MCIHMGVREMKNSILRRVYLEQIIFMVPAFWLLTYLWRNYYRDVGNGKEGYEWYGIFMIVLAVFFIVGITWYLMRKIRNEKSYSFMNALPITKTQELTVLIGVMFFLTVVLNIIGEMQLYFFYQQNITFGELLINIGVKTAVVFCVDCFFIWIFSHGVPGLGIFLLGILGAGICCGMLHSICEMFQKIFGILGNKPLYMGWNLWSFLTVPIQDFNREGQINHTVDELSSSYQSLLDIPVLTWDRKVKGDFIFIICMIVIIFLFIKQAKKNYAAGDLAAKRVHYPFHRAWKVILICLVCGAVTGTLGSLFLQYYEFSEYKDTIPAVSDRSEEVEQGLTEDNVRYGIEYKVKIVDFTGKRSCWGQVVQYRGRFWVYDHYHMKSSIFAKVVAIGSVLNGVILVLVIYGEICYEKKRRGAA